MLFIGCYNRSDRGKGKGISLFSILNPKINPEKKDLAGRWLFTIGTEWTTKKLIIKVEPKDFVMNTLRNLVLRLFEESCFEAELQKKLDLGGLNTQDLAQCLQYSILIPHRAMFNKREKKGSRSAQKRWQYLLHQIVGRQFFFKGCNKMAKKGREIKVHFIFVINKFASAKPLNLLIIYSIPSTSESYNCMAAGKGLYQMTSLNIFKS